MNTKNNDVQYKLLAEANNERLKAFFKSKHKALMFTGIFPKKYFNIHKLHNEYDFIPEKSDFGSFGYARLDCEFYFVKSQSIANSDVEYFFRTVPNNDILVSIIIPIYVPILDFKLNVSRNDENNKTEYLITETDFLNAYKNQLEQYSFVFIEGLRANVIQKDIYDGTGWTTPILNEKGLNTINNRMKKKWEEVTNSVNVVQYLFNSLMHEDVYRHLISWDFSEIEESESFEDFINLHEIENMNWLNKRDINYLKNESINKDFKQRFLMTVRKNFDLSWMKPILNKELKSNKRKMEKMLRQNQDMLNQHKNLGVNPLNENTAKYDDEVSTPEEQLTEYKWRFTENDLKSE